MWASWQARLCSRAPTTFMLLYMCRITSDWLMTCAMRPGVGSQSAKTPARKRTRISRGALPAGLKTLRRGE